MRSAPEHQPPPALPGGDEDIAIMKSAAEKAKSEVLKKVNSIEAELATVRRMLATCQVDLC